MKYLQLEQPTEFYAILENISDAFLCLDLQWRFSYFNQKALDLLGKEKKDLKEKALWEVFPDTSGTLLDLNFHSIIEERVPIFFETYYPVRNVWLKVRVHPYDNGIIIFFTDITDKKRAKAEVQSLMQRCNQCAGINPTGIFHLDEKGNHIFVNDKLLELTGLESEEISGKNFIDKISPNDKVFSETWNRAINAGKAVNTELNLINRKTLLSRQVSIKAFPVTGFNNKTYVGTIEDITEQVKAKSIVNDSERWFRNVVSYAPIMIWTADTDKRYNYLNENWLQFTGRTLEEELDNGWTEGIYPEDKERVLTVYTEAFENRETFKLEYRFKHRNGTYRWVSDTGKPLYAPDGSFTGYVESCTDIHEQVTVYQQMEKLVEEKTEALTHALQREKDLNALKSRFLSIVSHEFKTPLSTIMSSVGLINIYNSLDQPENVKKHTDKIKYSVNHLSNILEDFLSLDKFEQGIIKAEPQIFSLKIIASEAIAEVESILKKDQNILFIYWGTSTICSDKKIIHNIILNLLSNAIKYSEKDITLEVVTDKDKITISVTDEGIGIPEGDQEQLFSKYLRATNVGNIKGTGLGLNIVQWYVELLNGKIRFYSEENVETKFIVELPFEDCSKY